MGTPEKVTHEEQIRLYEGFSIGKPAKFLIKSISLIVLFYLFDCLFVDQPGVVIRIVGPSARDPFGRINW